MPTVLRSGPYRFYFYGNEGTEPPHVHVQQERTLAKFWLDPVSLASAGRFSAHELGRIERIIVENRLSLMDAWHEFFS